MLSNETSAWVCDENGELVPFVCERLAKSIQESAQSVGEEANDLAQAVAFAIYRYICDQKDRCIIECVEIVKVVESLLSFLGYEELAGTYALGNRHLELRFDEILARSEQCLELALYLHLDQILEVALEGDIGKLNLDGLRPYVMQLCGVQRWSRGCQKLTNEIVAYIRDRIVQLSSGRNTMLQVTITQ